MVHSPHSPSLPIRVVLMDDDWLARLAGAMLLVRDTRTTLQAEIATPAELLAWLPNQERKPHVIVVDVEYQDRLPVADFLHALQAAAPHTLVLCLTQYAHPDVAMSVAQSEAVGLLLKREVQLSLATAVCKARRGRFLYTPGVESVLRPRFPHLLTHSARLPVWQWHPDMAQARLRDVVWLTLVLGMSAPSVAQELGLAQATVERYRALAYDILGDGWHDIEDLIELLWPHKSEHQAYHYLTQPPAEA